MFKNICLTAIVTLCAFFMNAQQLEGIVTDEKGEPLIGAEVYWLNTSIGAITNVEGEFNIERTAQSDRLVVSYLSYQADTIAVSSDETSLYVVLREESKDLGEVVVAARAQSTVTSRVSAIQTQKITGEELCKAACCNLSESFETNASVDVAYSDAATGAKQIRMLGLSGTYVQMLTENTPGVRGLASNYGMEYIPGPWMESIQVSKGTSSVVNGYEATTGQINVEYLKPQTQEPLALNAMIASSLRAEMNATGGWAVNPYLSTGVLLHAKTEMWKHDGNGDGFIDIPLTNHVNLLNRWYYKRGDYIGQFLVRGLYDDRKGGQIGSHDGHTIENPYQININTKRLDGFIKNGYVFDAETGSSIGVIMSGSYHDQNGIYGNKYYNGSQANAYLNAMYQTNIKENHKITTGVSFNYDGYRENLDWKEVEHFNFDRQEFTPGVFAEYSYSYKEKLSLLAGLRYDWSSLYGGFVTPRVNVRYSPVTWWNVRASAGMGYRSPNLMSDFNFVMPSNRQIVLNANKFQQERALNAGISTTFFIPIQGRELQITGEYYYTRFFDGVVVDMDSDPHAIIFSNLNGAMAYAGNLQVEASMEILRGWTMTLAYRMSDVKTTINNQLVEKPLTNRFKGLITTSYQTPLKKWQFDVTAQLNGGGRMPTPDFVNPLWDAEFPMYEQLMLQVTRYFKTWSIYVGGENVTNFKQKNPIIGAENPWGPDFDGSMAWGPIHGAKVYVGFRWALNRKD